MEVKEETLSEEELRVPEKTIPVFTVLKNGAILKNIFVVNSRDFSSPERNGSTSDDDEVEEILVVGRHPDCDILLTHPSISRFHLEIRSISFRQKLFVTDLSSVHGTWVRDQRIEPHACVEVEEGDKIRIGGSTRIYRLHWIPLSRAYDFDNPFVSPLDASMVMDPEEENRKLDAENLEVAQHQSLANTGSGDDRDLHLDATSEGTGSSSVPSEDEGTDIIAWEISLPLASPRVLTLARDSIKTQKLQEDLQTSPKWDLNVIESVAEKLSSSFVPSKQQSGGYVEGLGCSELSAAAEADECDVRGAGGLHLNVMSERIESVVSYEDEDLYLAANEDEDLYLAANETSSLPLPKYSTNSETLWLTENVQASPELNISSVEANAEYPSSVCSPSEGQIDGYFEASGCSAFGLAAAVGTMCLHREVSEETEIATEEVMEASAKPVTKADIMSHEENGETEVSRQVFAVSPNSISQTEPTLEILTEEARGLIGSEFLSEVVVETESENLLHKKCIGEAKAETRSNEDYEETEVSTQVIAVTSNSFSQAEPTLEILTDEVRGLRGSEFISEVAVENEIENLLQQKSNGETKADIQSHEDNGETNVSRQVTAVSPNSFSQAEPTLEVLTEEAPGLEVKSEVAIEIESENVLHQTSSGETKVGSRQGSAVSNCLFAGNKCLARINTDDIQSLCSSWQSMPESEAGAPSEISSDVNTAGDQNQKSGMSRETAQIFDEGSSLCLSEDLKPSGTQIFLLTPNQKPKTELSIGSGRSEKYYSLRDIEGEENTDKQCPIPSTLAPETFDNAKPIKVLPSDDTGSQEYQTPQTHAVRDDVLPEMDSSSTCNIWSRRGKAASVLQIRTKTSKGKQKQIGNQPKDQLHRKQALSDKSISQTVDHGAENLEPEIFTPDKENLTPSSHMLKRLQDVGDVTDSKSSSKFSGKSCSSLIHSSIAIVASAAFKEPEIFTPDKENLTPNSHLLKRLREFGDVKETKGSSSKATRKPFFDIHLEENMMAEQKPDAHSMSSKSKGKHEPLAPKKKVERVPFQSLLENSSSQSQSYTEASSAASARNNVSRGIRFSSMLSDGKSKMKWTIVLDTSSLLDMESRKPLHLLQGLKGTNMVIPRTVLRELNEVKRTRSLLFRRRIEIASSALDWIEECKVNTKWWIQVQSPSEEIKATAPTPPVTPQSNGAAAFPFSFHWSNNAPEVDSPTSEDKVLECALLYRNRNRDEKLVLLSNDGTLKIKAMAEGVICETPHEFYESLVNPFSERFMWRESTARGRTWSHLDDVVLRERYNNRACRRKPTYNGGRGESGAAAKGLKLILLHNSHYGHTH